MLAAGEAGPFLEVARAEHFVTIDMRWPKRYIHAPAASSRKEALAQLPALGVAVRALHRAIAVARPDVVHVHTRKAHIVSALLLDHRAPTVFHLRDAVPSRRLLRAAIRAAVRRAGHAVALSSWVVDDYLALDALPRSGSIGLVPSGIRQKSLRALANPWLDGAASVRVGYVGQIAAWKGPHLLVDAAEAMPPEVPASFHIIGDVLFRGSEHEYGTWLRERIDRSKRRRNITWHPATPFPEEAMSMIDVLVHTSTSPEPFGRVLVEAMAALRPVVAFELGSTHEVLGAGWPYYAASMDGPAIAAVLSKIAGDRPAALATAHAAQRHASRFEPLEVAKRMDDEYKRLLA